MIDIYNRIVPPYDINKTLSKKSTKYYKNILKNNINKMIAYRSQASITYKIRKAIKENIDNLTMQQ
jgi:hypothetical protein